MHHLTIHPLHVRHRQRQHRAEESRIDVIAIAMGYEATPDPAHLPVDTQHLQGRSEAGTVKASGGPQHAQRFDFKAGFLDEFAAEGIQRRLTGLDAAARKADDAEKRLWGSDEQNLPTLDQDAVDGWSNTADGFACITHQ